MQHTAHLIVGYGYLGQRLRQQLADETCWYAGRSVNPAEPRALVLDINEPASWETLTAFQTAAAVVVYLMIPPGKIDVAILPKFLQALQGLTITRRILVSSTVVYGQQERVVDADSDVVIDSERARRQYQIEQCWMSAAEDACCVRLAGIYGPGRVIGKQAILQGEAISGNPEGWLNLIHVDDAAGLLKCLGERDRVAPYELGSDGTPLKRAEYYGTLARLLQKSAPGFRSDQTDSPRGRCCNNELTVARTGWLPRYTEIGQTLAALLELNEQ